MDATVATVEEALAAAQEADPGSEAALLDTLADARLVFAVRSPDDPTLVVLEQQGRPYVPAYTSLARAEGQVPTDLAVAQIALRDLAAQWPDDLALVINPGQQPAGILEGPGVRSLRDRRRSGLTTIPAGSTVLLGHPADDPAALCRAATEWLTADGRVERAHVAQLLVEHPGETPRAVIGLVLNDRHAGEAAELARGLGEHLRDRAVQADVLPLGPDADDQVGGWILRNTDPFYRAGDSRAGDSRA